MQRDASDALVAARIELDNAEAQLREFRRQGMNTTIALRRVNEAEKRLAELEPREPGEDAA